MDNSEAETNMQVPETFRTMYDLCDFMERLSGRQGRADEIVCYLMLNGNKASVEHYLSQRKGKDDSCIKYYLVRGNGDTEITTAGGKYALAQELRRFGISADELSLHPPKKTYCISSPSIEDGYKLLDISNNDTRCADLGDGVVEIETNIIPSRIAKMLGIREDEMYVPKNGRR